MSKLDYLDAFDSAFVALCGSRHAAARWAQGKWCNAHMHFDMGTEVAAGARRFFVDIMKYKSNQRELARLQAEAA